MGKARPVTDINPQVEAYRDLASEALESVAIYKARAQWFECSGNKSLANEYLTLAKDALERAQRYKYLADHAQKPAKVLEFETDQGSRTPDSEFDAGD
jgi:hypothetical protein